MAVERLHFLLLLRHLRRSVRNASDGVEYFHGILLWLLFVVMLMTSA